MASASQCCNHDAAQLRDRDYRRVLWTVLGLNAMMFAVEVVAGLTAGSVSLQADALDFLADTATYGISLSVVGATLRSRARAALAKGAAMGLFGLWVVAASVWRLAVGGVPEAFTMGVVGIAALLANAACLALLWAYRGGDSNMRSVWLCSRNDVMGNIAVLLAALGVFGTRSNWPDVTVAAVMAGLALHSSWQVLRQAAGELTEAHA